MQRHQHTMSPFNNNSHPTSSLQTLAVMVLVGLASLTACSEASDDGLSSSGTWVDADTAIPDTAFHETDASTGTPDTAPSDTSTPDTAIPDTSLQDSSSDSATIAEDSASTTEDSASTAEDADTGFEDTRIPQPDDVSPDESDTQEESCGADGDLPTATAEVTGRYHMYRDLGFGRAVDPGRVVVYLPESYDSDGPERYPVLYMHDGQNLFHDREAAFGVSWGVDDTLDALTRAGTIRPWIVVALDNTPARLDAYTPDADPDYGGGQSAVYMDLLVERIKPFIESRYRVLCGASHTALAGSSLGGLVSLDAMVRYPGLFGRVGALSPSLWWNGRSLLTRLAAFTGPLPQRVWLDAGTEEGSPTPTGAHTVSVNAR
ncbi:MAG: alpha/beta hydrolase-fold protein, partial [Myxococcota bacterium]